MAEPIAQSDTSGDAAEYSAVAPTAVASLVLGLLSPLALVGSLLWIVPALGIALAVMALRAIGLSKGDLTGRTAAYTGLALSTLFAVAAPVQTLYTRQHLSDAARPIADAWFEFLREREPQKALQLTVPQLQRRVLNERLWDYYRGSKETYDELEAFVASPVPRLILEHGTAAEARFYETHRVTTGADSDLIELVYAVTFPGSGQRVEVAGDSTRATRKQTIFVLVSVERRALDSGDIAWRIVNNLGGFRPATMLD